MRTAAICPTCATYENALCVLYNGPYLSCIGVSPLDSIEAALELIDGAVCLNSTQIANINNTLSSGFTGSRTIDGEVYTWTNGILISVV